MQTSHEQDRSVAEAPQEETKGGLQHYVLEVDEADEQKTSELVFIDNPVRNGSLRVFWLGVCFFLLFLSYNVAQGAVTTLFPRHGFYSLALIYLFLMAGSFVAPMLIPNPLSSPRLVLFGAAAMHCLFVASINIGPTALLVCSAGVGFSASFLWLQQGLYVTGVSQRAGGKIGKLTSIFFGIFNINMAVGSLISLLIELVGSEPTTVIWALTVISGVAGLAFLAIPNLPPAKVSGLNAPNSLPQTDFSGNQSRPTIASNASSVSLLALCRAAPMRNLAPIIIFNGAFVSFVFGTLPIIVDPSAPSLSIVHLAFAFVSYGVAAALGAFFWGRLFDWRGPRAILYAQLSIGTVIFILFLAVLIQGPDVSMFHVVMVASALCGALETATTTLINTCISVYVRPLMNHKDSAIAAAFSVYRILYCCGFVFVSLVSAAVPREHVVAVLAVPLSINLFFLLVGIASGLRMCANLPARLAASRSSSPTRLRTMAAVGSTPVYHEAMHDADGEQDTDYSRAGQGDEEDGQGSQASVGEVDVTQIHVAEVAPVSPSGKSRVASKASKVAGQLEERVTEMAKQTVRFVKGDFQRLDAPEEGSVPVSRLGERTAGEEFDLGERGGN